MRGTTCSIICVPCHGVPFLPRGVSSAPPLPVPATIPQSRMATASPIASPCQKGISCRSYTPVSSAKLVHWVLKAQQRILKSGKAGGVHAHQCWLCIVRMPESPRITPAMQHMYFLIHQYSPHPTAPLQQLLSENRAPPQSS